MEGRLAILRPDESTEFLIFENMQSPHPGPIRVEKLTIASGTLLRPVRTDLYFPSSLNNYGDASLLLINDGQNMEELGLRKLLARLDEAGETTPLICAAIHAGEQRKMEYGVAGTPDFKGRGSLASAYSNFILQELLPVIQRRFNTTRFHDQAFAGFSLGGLAAMDIVWKHPNTFSTAGVFSGSFWWRSVDQSEKIYNDDQHRIIHQQVRKGSFHPTLRFFFQCGKLDETRDRNKNGVIDSIDDTLDLIRELESKGYQRDQDIRYLELNDGKHDIATWGRAMPEFLKWRFGRSIVNGEW